MSLINCRECKKQISSTADKCPHCGAPKKKALGGGCALIVIIVVVFGIIGMAMDGPSSSPSQPAKIQKVVSVSIKHNRAAIEITNTGTADWPEAVIYINDTPPFTYKAVIAAPPIGQAAVVRLSDFTKKDGERFNPSAYALTEIWVGGSGYDFNKYDAR